jgi:hypothetical protein
MRLFFPLLTFSLLHSLGLVSGRRLDGDGETPRPTPEPLLYRDEFKHGAILMETSLGSPRNGTSRRDLALGARQVCDPHSPRDSVDVAVRIPATLATFSHVPLQNPSPAAPRRIPYVDLLSKQDHCSSLFRRSAARTLLQPCVVAKDSFASALLHAVPAAKSAVLHQRVRHLICLFSASS